MSGSVPGFALAAEGGERLSFAGGNFVIRASAETTGGAFSIVEEAPPLLDTPLHVHANEDELFYILEGDHVVQCGDDEFRLAPGGMAFLPRGVPHSQRRVEPGVGRLLVMISPGRVRGFLPRARRGGAGRHARPRCLRHRLGEVRHHLARLSSRSAARTSSGRDPTTPITSSPRRRMAWRPPRATKAEPRGGT